MRSDLQSACGHNPMVSECPKCFDFLYQYATQAELRLRQFGDCLEQIEKAVPETQAFWDAIKTAQLLLADKMPDPWRGAMIEVRPTGTWIVGPGWELKLEDIAGAVPSGAAMANFYHWLYQVRRPHDFRIDTKE